MKRGRPNKRELISQLILDMLSDNSARSVNSLATGIVKRLDSKVSWNTVQKYLQELVEVGRIEALSTPHSKIEGKRGLTVYILKK